MCDKFLLEWKTFVGAWAVEAAISRQSYKVCTSAPFDVEFVATMESVELHKTEKMFDVEAYLLLELLFCHRIKMNLKSQCYTAEYSCPSYFYVKKMSPRNQNF